MKRIIIVVGAIIVIGGAVALFFAGGGTIDTGEVVDSQVILTAVDKTFENESYDYDYDFDGKVMYKLAAEWGPWAEADMTGNLKFDKNATSTNYLINNQSSGSLLFDSKGYSYNIDDQNIEDKVNEDGLLLQRKTVGTYEGTPDSNMEMLNEMLLSLTIEDIDYVKYFESNSEYHVGLNQSAIEHVIQRIVRIVRYNVYKNISYVDIDKNLALTIVDGKINTVKFDLSTETKDIEFAFDMTQTFNAYDDVTMAIPDYDGVLVGDDLIAELLVIDGLFDDTFSSAYTNYGFDFKSQVDAGALSPSLGTNFRGTHINVIENGTNFFNNYYELDSDYKPELKDTKTSITVLNNAGKDAYIEVFKVLSNDFIKTTSYTELDEINFMVLDFDNVKDDVDFMIKTENGTKKMYVLGVSSLYSLELFDMLNASLDFEIYNCNDGLEIATISFEITVIDNKIDSIDIHSSGMFNDNSDVTQEYSIDLVYDIKTTDEADYVVPTVTEDMN